MVTLSYAPLTRSHLRYLPLAYTKDILPEQVAVRGTERGLRMYVKMKCRFVLPQSPQEPPLEPQLGV